MNDMIIIIFITIFILAIVVQPKLHIDDAAASAMLLMFDDAPKQLWHWQKKRTEMLYFWAHLVQTKEDLGLLYIVCRK